MSELAIINDYNAAKVPPSISDEEAAMIEPVPVALYAVDRGGVQAGSTVLICGAGIDRRLDHPLRTSGRRRQDFHIRAEPGTALKAIESFGICAGIFDLMKADVGA